MVRTGRGQGRGFRALQEDLDFCSEWGGSHRGFSSRGGIFPDLRAHMCPMAAVGGDGGCGGWR